MVGGAAVVDKVTTIDTAGRPTAGQTDVPTIDGWIEAGLAKSYRWMKSYHPNGQDKEYTTEGVAGLSAETLRYGYDTIGRPRSLGGQGSYVGDAIYSGLGPLLQTAHGTEQCRSP